MAVETPPGVLDGPETPDAETGAAVQRHTTTALAAGRAGACGATDLAVSQSSTPAMTVRVAAGYALVAGSTTTYQGMYSFHNDAAVDDLAISPGDPANPRNDIVVAQVRDASYAGSDKDARLFVVEGTPAGAPSDPSLPASCLALARVRVDANESTSIVNADITDLREFAGDWASAWGRVAGVTGTTQQTGITTITDITSMSVTFDAVAGRRYEIMAEVSVQQITNAATVTITLADGSNNVLRVVALSLDATYHGTIPIGYDYEAASSSSVTFKLRATSSAASLTLRPAGITQHRLIAKDVGPI